MHCHLLFSSLSYLLPCFTIIYPSPWVIPFYSLPRSLLNSTWTSSFLSHSFHTLIYPSYPSFPLQSQLPPPRTPSATFTSFHLLFAFIPFLLSKAKSNLFHTPTFPTRSFSLSIQLFILYHTPTLSPSTRFISHPPALNIRNIAVILSGF